MTCCHCSFALQKSKEAKNGKKSWINGEKHLTAGQKAKEDLEMKNVLPVATYIDDRLVHEDTSAFSIESF